MARQKPRKAFPEHQVTAAPAPIKGDEVLSTQRVGIMGFLSDRGVRETIESIIVAVILALLFRTFEAEAFVIPTGSMAPTLQGQHRDVNCEKCNYLYQTGASEESPTRSPDSRAIVQYSYCPICQYKTNLNPKKNPDHSSNNGDRILVNKSIYDFSDPKRFDVIVFKNPNNGKQNYIKRLVGLPNENIVIENGDIFSLSKDESGNEVRDIIRKPPKKLKAMLQMVDDTDFIPEEMHDAGWPLRWNQWNRAEGESGWDSTVADSKPTFAIDENSNTQWLRYRHLVPLSRSIDINVQDGSTSRELNEWELIEKGELPNRIKQESPNGRLITDYYSYNHKIAKSIPPPNQPAARPKTWYQQSRALHWVGDLAMECFADIKSKSGEISFELVEGGAKFTCTVDIKTGVATLSSDYDTVSFVNENGETVENPSGKTKLKGSGNYRILYANVDDQLYLAINNRFVEFDAATYKRTDKTRPRSFPDDKSNMGDAEPAAVGAKNVKMEISRLKILRDVYYTSPIPKPGTQKDLDNETMVSRVEQVWRWFDKPSLWESDAAKKHFMSRFRSDPFLYELKADQFLPMGDNSPASLDGRVWDGPKYVGRDMLIGRALFIYWPHSLNSPIPYFPNFGKMGFIR